MAFVDAPGIAPGKLEDRRYQADMAKGCMRENTLVILPTGLGKTAVAARVAAEVLTKGRKVLIMAPTKPLVDQHRGYFSSVLPSFVIGLLNGNMDPKKRADVVSASDMIISTPQCIENDLDSRRYSLKDFGLVVFDEAHKATGSYAYVGVAEHISPGTYVIGMTASPGSDLKKIEEVCNNLSISRIDVRSDDDPDVSPYVHDTYVNRIVVNMPQDLVDVSNMFKELLNQYFGELMSLRLVVNPNWPASTKHMLAIGQTLQIRLARGEKTSTVFRGLTVQSICIKILRAIDYAETQGMSTLRSFLQKINEGAESEDGSRADRELVSRENYKKIWKIVSTSRVEHPKISRIMSLVSRVLSEGEGSKIIIFTQYRESCDIIAEKVSAVGGAKVCKLIGQANGGQKQKEQIGTLDDFRRGVYNVVVATSVGEEGLDIASTNAVIFYEPVPSEIRTIQRRGRTGRKNDGEVYMLIAADTMDEVVEQASKKKEAAMRERLETLSRDLSRNRVLPRGQSQLGRF
ncbi:ERCC4-like helicase [Thermoplasmatales archaeon BRNA1]|nr:ERCC4-like helicase [Thermoplasmatales archaeon BRNA1]